MPEKKVSRRVLYTRNALRDAFIDLITEQPLSDITVTDICARADINRSTFYLHYRDVDALLVEIENNIIDHIEQEFSRAPHEHVFEELVAFLKLLQQTPRIPKLLYALTGEQGDPRFIRRLQQLLFNAFQQGWDLLMPESSRSYKFLIYSYTLPGVISLLSSWLRGDAPDMTAEQTVELLHTLITHGMSGSSPLFLRPGAGVLNLS